MRKSIPVLAATAGICLFLLAACPCTIAAEAPAGVFKLSGDEYPIGVYSADPFSDEILQKIKETGINYVQSYNMGDDSEEALEKSRQYLDQCARHGLKMMFNLAVVKNSLKTSDRDGIERMLKVARAFKDHPALGFWYLYDEPAKNELGKLKPFYLALKKETLTIPVAIVNNWNEEWDEFYDSMDFQMVDIYPVKSQEFPNAPMQTFAHFIGAAQKNVKHLPVMAVGQLYRYRKQSEGEWLKKQGHDPEKLRYPNREEFRYTMYASLALGTRGYFLFSYYYASRDENSWLETVATPEIKGFAEFVETVKPAHKPVILKRAADENLLAAYWKRGGETYLVLVNSWPLERKIVRNCEGLAKTAELSPLPGTRASEAKILDGNIVAEVLPWESLVWKVVEKK